MLTDDLALAPGWCVVEQHARDAQCHTLMQHESSNVEVSNQKTRSCDEIGIHPAVIGVIVLNGKSRNKSTRNIQDIQAIQESKAVKDDSKNAICRYKC